MSSFARTAMRAPAPVALMAVIFWLSSLPDLGSGLGVWDLIGRKIAHALVFGLLALLWWWALRPSTGRAILTAGTIAFAYAAFDEWHQTLVEGRSGSPIDVAIDLVGILGVAALLRYDRRVRRALDRDGEFPERGVAMPADRPTASGARRRTRGAREAVRDRGDRLRQGGPSAPD